MKTSALHCETIRKEDRFYLRVESLPHDLELKLEAKLGDVGQEDLCELVNLRGHVGVSAALQVQADLGAGGG